MRVPFILALLFFIPFMTLPNLFSITLVLRSPPGEIEKEKRNLKSDLDQNLSSPSPNYVSPFTAKVNPLDIGFNHLFKNNPPPRVKPEDLIEYAVKEGAPHKKYVWVNGILVPEFLLNVYRRTLRTKGPIFKPSTRFPEELKNDPDALFKFKVRTLGRILWAVYTTHNPTFSDPTFERRLQRVEENCGWGGHPMQSATNE
ncbi:hypothetical protein C5167_019955 [Papaver somniferum]|uniref:Uncharacterized protein n=1 Tax=Papaver somniferum TaxID=3469 RepID=A0A4Y7IUR9_PAPSO|nr:uncharacterized protein LOC113354048 [Papaver somniferum]RZC51530.1 hypothetical protein C5167_019955 [Papaver somniferum]